MNIGFDKKGEPRTSAGIIHILKDATKNGNTGLPFSELVARTHKLLNIEHQNITDGIKALTGSGTLVCRQVEDKPGMDDLYCLEKLYKYEQTISGKLHDLKSSGDGIEPKEHDCMFGDYAYDDLENDQVAGIEKAINNKVFILTGAPGTGKTYLLKKIIEAFPKDTRVIMAAPTGKAARRMTEQSGKEAFTMHRVLEPEAYYTSNNKLKFRFKRDSLNPINADLIILDEASMIDVSLMASFLEAIPSHARLILVGDTYQLPSVGPGNVLKDMINSGLIPTTELTIIKRQDEGLIIQNCHKIKNGKSIEIKNSKAKDFFFLTHNTEGIIKKTIIELISKRLPKAYKADSLRDIQIISPLREKTGLSCKWLNKACQEVLNKNPSIDKIPFRIGDKVIQVKNEYELGVINGDIGFIHSINLGDKNYIVDFQNIEGLTEIPLYGNNLQLAYALTCHKFQGSESRIVIIPIHKSFGPLIMQRNWLYTAISRAKEVCVLVGQFGEIPKIIRRNKQQKRFTNLEQFLRDNSKDRERGTNINDVAGIEGVTVIPDLPPGRYTPLEQAILILAGDCDGAVADDGKGFNAYDTEFGHELADMIQIRDYKDSPLGRLSFNEYERAFHMIRKYRGQLMSAGIDYERITPKPVRRE
jgi:exodeoxyribonuclease V alpha subunit